LIRGALYGHGDFELANPNHPMKISKIAWDNKISEQKTSHFEKFIKNPPTKNIQFVTSTDGKLIISSTSTTAKKKPGQKRRIKNSKTFSYKRARVD